ncbi:MULTISPECIES: hypothetical protein [Breznakia]|uniref:Uncharacterized protein n=1 Tax=Breznakia blatticola TaxID=1754012 RepID=A0A4V3G7S5_9FIRM|nr:MULTISPECIES: hypothetical protein [Breznakia]MDH6367502.1 hypothetical protein [Breznakia sp. PH1-1]MDH6404622.1 hypothetical protein [Breznakia sp. PF1-11]MDH6412331.1 hypothetical protein [Breznakia sp. PFB1-11]MDH6414669.1 hypothetical protein [Breznakia sp. PFB1-14]MDH6416936.1 hypothetical protein [Breznakia sp. PFB1-4]
MNNLKTKKELKKNKSMRLASGLLVVTLLTTAIVSGTFAKYTTTAVGENTARVAKWGVVMTADNNIFGTDYKDAANGNTITTDVTDNSISVSALANSDKTRDNVLAPGTKNDTFNLNLTGTPEVDGVITGELKTQNFRIRGDKYFQMKKTSISTEAEYKAYSGEYDLYVLRDSDSYYAKTNGYTKDGDVFYEAVEIANLEKSDGNAGPDYYPITFKMTNQDGTDWNGFTNPTGASAYQQDTLELIANKFNAVYKTSGVNFESGTDLSQAALPKITWEWAFTHDDSTTNGKYDKVDTMIGNVMAANRGDTDFDVNCFASTGFNGMQGEFMKEKGLDGAYLGKPFGPSSFKVMFNLNLTITQRD